MARINIFFPPNNRIQIHMCATKSIYSSCDIELTSKKPTCMKTLPSCVGPQIVPLNLQPISDLSLTQEVISRDEHNKIPFTVFKVCTDLLTSGEVTPRQQGYKDFPLPC